MDTIKFNMELDAFKKHINFVRNGLGATMSTDLAVKLIRCDLVGTKLVLFTANKEMFCRTEMKIKRDDDDEGKDASFAVLGSKLEKIVAEVVGTTINFSLDSENLEVQVGGLTVNLETLDGAVLKTIERGVSEHLEMEGLALSRAFFDEALSCAKSCSPTSSTGRPEVMHCELRKGRMFSSDGRKVLSYSYDGFSEDIEFKCPSGMISGFLGAVKNIDNDAIQIIKGNTYYYVKANKNEFSCGVRKVERIFPPVEEQLAGTGEPTDDIDIDIHAFSSMVRGVAIGLPSDDVRVTAEINGKGGDAYLEIASFNKNGRKSFERNSISRKKSDKLITFPLSFKHILDTLAVFKGDNSVDIRVMAARGFIIIRDTTENREVLTMIPFRTDKAIEDERKEAEAAIDARKKEKEPEKKTSDEETNLAAAAAEAGKAVSSAELDLE